MQCRTGPSKAKHPLSTGALREAPVDNECFALVCSALLCILCLANLEGQAKWAKAIFEGVPTLRYPGLGTLATSLEGQAKWAKAIFEGGTHA